MNLDLNTKEWTKLISLTDDVTYQLQSKYINIDGKIFNQNILLTQSTTEPTDLNSGFYCDKFKFTKKDGINIYVRAVAIPTNVQIEEAV